MNQELPQLSAEAMRLLLMSFKSANTPANNEQYGTLVRRYLGEQVFRDVTNALAEEMGLCILSESNLHGLILGATPNSPFAPTLEDFRAGMPLKVRTAFGFLHFVLLAFLYPNRESLSEDSSELSNKIQVGHLLAFTRDKCNSLKSTVPFLDAATEEQIEGFNHLLSLPELEATGKRNSLQGMLRYLLQSYADQGLLQKDPDNDDIFRARPQFRIHARRMLTVTHDAIMAQLRPTTPPTSHA